MNPRTTFTHFNGTTSDVKITVEQDGYTCYTPMFSSLENVVESSFEDAIRHNHSLFKKQYQKLGFPALKDGRKLPHDRELKMKDRLRRKLAERNRKKNNN